jgi:tryptophan synthase beta chain
LLQDENGQIHETDSISAGLDYPGVGPEHALLHAAGRVQYGSATDAEALAALTECSRLEGILPALETAHALHGMKLWAANHPGHHGILCLSGRGDKDMPTLQRSLLEDNA